MWFNNFRLPRLDVVLGHLDAGMAKEFLGGYWVFHIRGNLAADIVLMETIVTG